MKRIKTLMTAFVTTTVSFGVLPTLSGAAAMSPGTLKPRQPVWTQAQPFVLAQTWRTCQQLGSESREVMAFETPNYYVNICLQRLTDRKSRYVYVAEQKNNPSDRLVLTAQPLSPARYQSSSTDTVYTVTNYLQVPDASRGGFELVVTQNGRVVQLENSIRGFDSSNGSPRSQAAPPTLKDTILTFRTRNYAVRLYRQGGQTVMNVFNRSNKSLLLRRTPVRTEQNSEGYTYRNAIGRVPIAVFQPQASNSYSIQIGDDSPEAAI